MYVSGALGNWSTSFMNTVRKALAAIWYTTKCSVFALGRKFKAFGTAVKNWAVNVWKTITGTKRRVVKRKGK